MITFGLFLHMGGGNAVPLTYVDNCAEAIVLAGIRAKVEGETCKVVVDDLPTGREFLRLYQRNVHRVASTGLEGVLKVVGASLLRRSPAPIEALSIAVVIPDALL